jgi:hypothetical protein
MKLGGKKGVPYRGLLDNWRGVAQNTASQRE